ncbi:IS4 family transposase ISDha5 [Bacteroidia bacterium]|nr:IS4 family transposase ISDha5 [Bacteroidia bacterium]
MLRDKGNIKISELQTSYTPDGVDSNSVLSGFKALKLAESFSAFNNIKVRGYGFKDVLAVLILMVVHSEKTVHSYLSGFFGKEVSMKKDVFYRLKNLETIGWRMILWHIAGRFMNVTSANSTTGGNKPRYLIFDDTTIEKTGKKMEFIGRVWDHVTQKSVLGFKVLTMLYWDGISSIPLDFSIHREKGKREEYPYGMRKKDLRRQFSKKRIKESCSVKRIKELDMNKINVAMKMFYSAVYRCVKIDYVLVDSWFTCDALIQAVRSVKEQTVHLIGMYKIATTKFEFRGMRLTHAQINNRLGKPKRCRRLGYQYKEASVVHNGMRLTLFFSRRGKRDDWKVILTTDTSLSFIKAIEHYQVRWAIEVFYKETKGLLNLGGCQSSNFDAQIADTTVSMITYILLSFRYRYENYESMGALFRSMNADSLRQTLDIRLWGLFLEMIRVVTNVFEIDADELLEKMLTDPVAEQRLTQMLGNCLQEAG